jgi:hypothetical protein
MAMKVTLKLDEEDIDIKLSAVTSLNKKTLEFIDSFVRGSKVSVNLRLDLPNDCINVLVHRESSILADVPFIDHPVQPTHSTYAPGEVPTWSVSGPVNAPSS